MTFAPIHYTRQQVALMIRIASALNPRALRRRTRESSERIARMAQGKTSPSPSMLRYFELSKNGVTYTWLPK